jgi:hypothetical protein
MFWTLKDLYTFMSWIISNFLQRKVINYVSRNYIFFLFVCHHHRLTEPPCGDSGDVRRTYICFLGSSPFSRGACKEFMYFQSTIKYLYNYNFLYYCNSILALGEALYRRSINPKLGYILQRWFSIWLYVRISMRWLWVLMPATSS